ncbi:MAG: DEAD/DEAH box helicase [Planctomycetota bacterium]|nr:DEAD/DEAH box helicase [Planctomycetota bacterium]
MGSSTTNRSLSEPLAKWFSSAVRGRGLRYFQQGSVGKLKGGPTSVDTSVQGSELYRVALHFRPANAMLSVRCDCPFGEEFAGPCKHAWATILKAEKEGLLSAVLDARRPRVQVEHGDHDEAIEDEFDEEPDVLDAAPGRPADSKIQEMSRILKDFAGQKGGKINPSAKEQFLKLMEGIGSLSKRHPARAGGGEAASAPAPPKKPDWEVALGRIKSAVAHGSRSPRATDWDPARRELWYTLDWSRARTEGRFCFQITHRERKINGEWGKHKTQGVRLDEVDRMPPGPDRDALAMVFGSRPSQYSYASSYYYDSVATQFTLEPALEPLVLPLLCRTGRCVLQPIDQGEPTPLRWDDSQPARFSLTIERVDGRMEGRGSYTPQPRIWRGGSEVPLAGTLMISPGGTLLNQDVLMPIQHVEAALRWIPVLVDQKKVRLPADQADRWLGEVLEMVDHKVLELPEDLRVERVEAKPRLRLRLRSRKEQSYSAAKKLGGDLSFDYEGQVIAENETRRGVYVPQGRRYVGRSDGEERAAADRLVSLGFRPDKYAAEGGYELPVSRMSAAVRALTAEGWHVEADGKLHRTAGEINVQVASGIDWFELRGQATFGDQVVDLPTLLQAIKRGDGTVVLGDGTLGMLPDEWLTRFGALGDLGKSDGDHVKFGRTQVGLLDALLAAQPQVSVDEAFAKAREELRAFEGIAPAEPPPSFVGSLRTYQAEGLGWLHFLRRFHFGGCLADDMGLGKTVQVLALLESRRLLRNQASAEGKPRPGPSLVVVPRSLIFNWKQEAAKFAPELRVLDHTGADRTRAVDHFDECDLVLTTYGTLRRDAAFFKDASFDYVILDEAQAIKNAATGSAKAVRLLRGEHRLVMSGTPIENHLGDLWSLYDFLNPGMLGARNTLGMAAGKAAEPESRVMLAQALRPFILRRTKQQVAKDLPQKTEQSIHCDLPAEQRALYNELREHYRQSLLGRIETEGLAKSKIHVLEALLRLRQAACHPGLIDKARAGERSAKLDFLVPRILEVAQEGHKAIVFSQFTTFLGLLKKRLAAEPGSPQFEYLDGKTADRQARVENFQNNPECKIFLISLKAGGFGLNLTAAEYVFLLDPWWNPAVEAQAIDRAHRIGQDKPVFAYRLIARDTVEEKIVELQDSKRALADAIISADNSLIRSLTRDDLEMLLS